ncbi:MAG: site-specific integrase [Negativicutes bacterium]|nr:site-specific integrase [Negativicutes bacterium]
MRGSLIKNHGKYFLVVDVGIDPETKKRKQKWINTGTNNKKAAEDLMPSLMQQIVTGQYIEPTDQTVKEYLDEWLEVAKGKVRPGTYDTYVWSVNSICKVIGLIELKKLRPMDIQKYYQKKLSQGLSPTSVRYHHRVLFMAYRQAVKWQLIQHNPCEAVDPPKKAEFEAPILDAEQVLKMLDHFRLTVYYLPILMAISTGMRRGEVCGLRWEDVDIEKKMLTIKNTLETRDKKPSLGPVKTKKSQRKVRIPSDLLALLKREKVRYAENKLRNGETFNDLGYVWCWEDGRSRSPDHLTHKFQEGMAEAELPVIRFHDLRHTFATLMLQEGIDLKTISEQLGHATQYFTSDVYGHVTDPMRNKVSATVDRITRKKAPKKENIKAR